jgi:hypothetical protein
MLLEGKTILLNESKHSISFIFFWTRFAKHIHIMCSTKRDGCFSDIIYPLKQRKLVS